MKKKNNALSKVPPTSLTDEALKHYQRIMPTLIANGVVTDIDVPILESACELFAEYKKDISGGLNYINAYIKIMERYGATEKARFSMKIAKQAKKKDSKEKSIMEEFDKR